MLKSWYLIYTRENSEKRICSLLKKKNIETYCPHNRRQLRQFNRVKLFSEPLFTSFIFARLGDDDLKIIAKLKSTINIAFWKNNYAVISDEEIKTIKEFVLHNQNIKLEKSKVGMGEIIITNSPNYSNNINSVSIKAGLYKVLLPSIGFTMIAEAQKEREREFENDQSKFSISIRSILQT